MLIGKLTNLRAVESTDYELLWKWANTPEVMQYWGRSGNTESLAQVAEREKAEASRGNSAKFIVETKDQRAIGQIDYYDLNWQSRSAWVSILIAEKEYWGGGYGTDAMHVLLRFLFRELGLHRVALNVHETNVRAQRSYEKNGFVREGVMRDWTFFDGAWRDAILMSVLTEDFVD